MTDHDDRDPLKAAFEDYRRAPEDVVMRRGMTTDAMLDIDQNCHRDNPLRNGGSMVYDDDGNPEGMEPTDEYRRELSDAYMVDADLVHKLGLDGERLPNARILDLKAMNQ